MFDREAEQAARIALQRLIPRARMFIGDAELECRWGANESFQVKARTWVGVLAVVRATLGESAEARFAAQTVNGHRPNVTSSFP